MRDPLIIHFIMAAAALWPLLRLFRRAGLPPFGAFLILVPMIGPALVASVLVFRKWPNLPPKPELPRRRRR